MEQTTESYFLKSFYSTRPIVNYKEFIAPIISSSYNSFLHSVKIINTCQMFRVIQTSHVFIREIDSFQATFVHNILLHSFKINYLNGSCPKLKFMFCFMYGFTYYFLICHLALVYIFAIVIKNINFVINTIYVKKRATTQQNILSALILAHKLQR